MTASTVDEVVVATTEKNRDDIIARHAKKEGAMIFRGDEDDVLGRLYTSAEEYNADTVVRVTADNPLLSPEAIDSAVQKLHQKGLDYVSNKIHKTFPVGLDTEAFDLDSFRDVEKLADSPEYREHVTLYYRDSEGFETSNLGSKEVFDEEYLHDRTDLRLTLDEPDDYQIIRRVYEEVPYNEVVDLREAVQYIDNKDLNEINRYVNQKGT